MNATHMHQELFGGLRGGAPGQRYRSRDGHEVTLSHKDTDLDLWALTDGDVMLSAAWQLLGYRRVDDTPAAR